MYSCGPTVYNYAHIGNFRTYIFLDILRRALKFNGYKIKGVLNITDVGHLLSDADEGEDKMQKAAREQKKTPYEIAEYYTNAFFEDYKKLNIEKTELTPKATEHIKEMLDFVYGLCEKGYGYETSDGIYFDISKFPSYGRLSGINLEEQLAGARVEVNDEKRNSYDFALWKNAAKEHIMQWDSRFGKGFPGWHIECSAMSKKYLGDVFDIHTGGVDHIPIHHENEIAQSEALTGKNPARVWMHAEFMLFENGKMSKKLGNTYAISDLEKMGYSPMDFRYFCLNAHYRKKLNFTFEALAAAKIAYQRLCGLVLKHKNGENKTDESVINSFKEAFAAEVNDDLNIPAALGLLWNLLKEKPSKDIYNLILYADKIFALDLDKAAPAVEEPAFNIPSEITILAEKRLLAKKEKNYALSDELRKAINEKGFEIIDKADGYVIKVK